MVWVWCALGGCACVVWQLLLSSPVRVCVRNRQYCVFPLFFVWRLLFRLTPRACVYLMAWVHQCLVYLGLYTVGGWTVWWHHMITVECAYSERCISGVVNLIHQLRDTLPRAGPVRGVERCQIIVTFWFSWLPRPSEGFRASHRIMRAITHIISLVLPLLSSSPWVSSSKMAWEWLLFFP